METEGKVDVSGGTINANIVAGQIVTVDRPPDKTKRIVAIVLGLAGILLVLVLLTKQLLPSAPQPVSENTEILLDRSAAMAQAFEGGTKMDAAIASVEKIFADKVADGDNLAFRAFGGPCNSTQLTVPFNTHNEKRIRSSLQQIAPNGENNLVHAVVEATADFNPPERFKGVQKRILVITGGSDTCNGQLDAIQKRLEDSRVGESGIKVDFRFIGIGLTPQEEQSVQGIASATHGEAPIFVYNRKDLDNVVQHILVVEPVVNDAQLMTSTLNSGIALLNAVGGDLNNRDYSGAERDLEASRKQFALSNTPFEDLGKRQSREDFKKVYAIASANWQLQKELVGLAEIMVGQAKSQRIDDYNATISKFNDGINRYNANVEALNNSLRDLNAKL